MTSLTYIKENHTSSLLSRNKRLNLTDFSFLIPLQIDSEYRRENADASINFILNHFETTIIVIEGDLTRKYYPEFKNSEFNYKFILDDYLFFYKTKYINKLFEMAETPFVAVWDADAIIHSSQVLKSAEVLRKREAVMSIPYDGRAFMCDRYLSDTFKKTHNIEMLMKVMPGLPLMYGYHSTGGAFMADKENYLKTGGENENFQGWGPEDADRIKRLEVLHLNVHNSIGPFFHLWHPRGQRSCYTDRKSEITNRRELIKTCQKNIS